MKKRPFGHLDVSVGNSEKAGKLCNEHFQNNCICMFEALVQQISKF